MRTSNTQFSFPASQSQLFVIYVCERLPHWEKCAEKRNLILRLCWTLHYSAPEVEQPCSCKFASLARWRSRIVTIPFFPESYWSGGMGAPRYYHCVRFFKCWWKNETLLRPNTRRNSWHLQLIFIYLFTQLELPVRFFPLQLFILL